MNGLPSIAQALEYAGIRAIASRALERILGESKQSAVRPVKGVAGDSPPWRHLGRRGKGITRRPSDPARRAHGLATGFHDIAWSGRADRNRQWPGASRLWLHRSVPGSPERPSVTYCSDAVSSRVG